VKTRLARNRAGSVIIQGDILGASEVTSALFAAATANQAERSHRA